MPKTRTTEMPQRPSPRGGGPPNLRTSSSDSDSVHHRPRMTDRSPKLSDGRSPRGSRSEPVSQKKLGSRISDLESQLGQAQDELKCLKNQLSTAEAAKKAAQEQLDRKSKKQPKRVVNVPKPVEIHEKHSATTVEIQESNRASSEVVDQEETDVYEVPIENVIVEPKAELGPPAVQDAALKPESLSALDELALKDDELNMMKTELDKRDGELDVLRQENENMKKQLDEKSLKISSAESEIEELTLRLSKTDQELGKSQSSGARMNEKLEATEKAKEELENEMKRLRVQTEQWRKAADAAANILAGETEMNGRRLSERCGSMDKHYDHAFEPTGGRYTGFEGSPGLVDGPDDGFRGGKRKGGSGIRAFGDLWKKKGNK